METRKVFRNNKIKKTRFIKVKKGGYSNHGYHKIKAVNMGNCKTTENVKY